MVISGTEGKIVVLYFHMAVKARLTGKIKQTVKNGGKMDFNAAYLPEFDDTVADIRNGKTQSSIVPHKATLDTMELLDTCRKQMGVVFPCEKADSPARQLNTTIRAISHLGFNCKDLVGAFCKSVPGNHSLNYTHFSIEVENIRDFRQAIIDQGGAKYMDGEITLGVDKTWQMWMHDPEGNKFELMEYTEDSYQIKSMCLK